MGRGGTGGTELPRLRTEYARARQRKAEEPEKGSSGGGRRALEQASATENVGYAVPGHSEERQLKGGALGGFGAA